MKEECGFKRTLKTISTLSTVGMYLSGIGIFIMSLLITIEIAGRYLFGFSLLVVDEWSGYLLVIVAFLGLAYTMKTKGFLQIEFLTHKLSRKRKCFYNFLLLLVAAAYTLLIGYRLLMHTWSSYDSGEVSISISQTPLYIPQLFMPVGMLLLLLELIREAVGSLDEWLALKGD